MKSGIRFWVCSTLGASRLACLVRSMGAVGVPPGLPDASHVSGTSKKNAM